ncbi:protein of unknown function [Pseudomonas sp. JV551A1]|uniref:Uncharacterized protein n=1 Tax=Pseudomonas inefficax TaxID=2078786 RepID=A0AAQ1P7C4_9PSED|nr:hypothetical protein [Pseudomonas]SPO53199.1 protein of unknown function [Pseudomonas sp. JV551A1]SPO59178.1 protein of unknown function [Pseudomonas inefficax]
MLAYKIMRSRYYKPGAKVLTSKANYGKRMFKDQPTTALILSALDLSRQYSLSFQQILWMFLDFQNRSYQPRIPDKISDTQRRELIALANSSNRILDEKFSATFWETLYEQVRIADRPTCPTRLKSYFASKDIPSLSQYRDKHWGDKMGDKLACEIEIKACKVVFEADMVILDRVTEEMNFESARPHILRYWDQEVSNQPIAELLLQGTVALGKRVQLA